MHCLCLCLCCSSSPISVSTSFSSRHFPPLGFLRFKPLVCPKLPLLAPPLYSRCKSSKEQQLPVPVPGREFEFESGGEEEEDDDDEEDDEFDEYKDDEITADEYAVDADASEEEQEDEGVGEGSYSDSVGPLRQSEEDKAERVKKLVAEAREFGSEIIDYQELAAIYDFPIDRFQVHFPQSL